MLNEVTLTGELGPAAVGAVAVFAPSGWLEDSTHLLLLPPAPQRVTLLDDGALTVSLLPTDASGPAPAGWNWSVLFDGIQGVQPYGFSFFLPAGPFSFSATQATPAVFTAPGSSGNTVISNGMGVTLSGGSLPGGFSGSTTYYVVAASGGETFSLAATPGGSPLASTSAGSGTLTVVSADISALAQVKPSTPMASFLQGTYPGGTADYLRADGQWAAPPGGGSGAVDSVNGQTGVVVLAAAQVGADTSGAAATAQSNAEAFATSAVATETTRAESAEAGLMPLPSGTPSAGQLPVASGTGEGSAWGTAGVMATPPAAYSAGKWITQGGPQPAQILTEFQAGHGYTASAGTFNANDTSNFVMGSQAASIVTGGTGVATNISNVGQPSFTTVNRTIRLRLEVDDITHLAGLSFFLGPSSLANNYKWTIQTSPVGSNYVISGQWLIVTLCWHDAVVTGSPSRSALTDVRIAVTDDGTAGVTVRLQSIELLPDASAIFPNGVISITWDDSYQDAMTYGKPRLDLYGYPATVFSITSLIGTSGRLTLTELKQLQDLQGWELGGHAYTDADHSARFTGLTGAALDADLRQLKAWGDQEGFRGSMGLAYPGGQYGLTTDSQYTTDIVRQYNAYARLTTSKTKETLPPGDPFRLRAITDISSFSGGYAPANLTQAGGDLDLCAANQTWLILSFHEVVTTTPTADTQILQSDFNAIIDSINSHGIPVLPVGDVLRRLEAPAGVTPDTSAGDIQPLGTQATGSTGKPPDAGHVHPAPYGLQAADRGLIAASGDFAAVASSNAPTLGTLFLTRVRIPAPATVSNILTAVITTGTPTGVYFGLYSAAGTLVAQTADRHADAAIATAAALETAPLTAPYPAAAGLYWVGILQTGGTGAAFGRVNNSGNAGTVNAGLSAAAGNLLAGTAGSALSVLPASITPSAMTPTVNVYTTGLS